MVSKCAMINKINARKYCSEDISKIENYEQAVNDNTQTWICHHRAEILPCGRYKAFDLMLNNLYFLRPAAELIFLTPKEHRRIHQLGQPSGATGKKHTEDWKTEQSKRFVGMLVWNNGNVVKRSKECPGEGWTRGYPEHIKAKIAKDRKGKSPWNKGKTGVYSEETRKKMSQSAKLRRNRH